MIVRSKHNGYSRDGSRRVFGGGGGGVKYENLERLYEIQARQAEGLMDQANQNVYPTYNQLLEEAKNTGTIANQEAAAGRAAAEAMASGTAAKQKTAADLASMGVNPNDQRWVNTNAAIDLDTTARSAAAQSGARSYVRDLGFARTTDLVNSGMGIGSNAVAALNSAGGMASNIGNLQMQSQANRDANLGNIAALGTRLFMNTGGLVPKKYSEGDGLPLMRPLPGPVTKAAAQAAKGTLDPLDLRDGAGDGHGGNGQDANGDGLGISATDADGLGQGIGGGAVGSDGNGPGGGGGVGADGNGGGVGGSGSDGSGGGFGGDSGDGYARGGMVLKYAGGGRVPMVGGIKGYARGGIIGAMQAISPAPPPPSTRTASPMARAGQQVVTGGAGGAGTLVENVGNLVGKIAPEAGNSISSFGTGLRLGDKAQPAIEAYKAAATGAEAATTAAAGAEAAGTVAAGAEAAGTVAAGAEAAGVAAAGAEAAGATATAMGAGSAIGSALGAAMPWVGAAMLIGSAFDLFADGGEVKSHKIGGRQGPDGVAENETGGKVDGPGGPKEDKVMARLSPEEFVMPVATVKLFGLDRLEKMRQLGLRYEKQLGIR